MIQSPDSEFENENDSQEEEIEVQENILNNFILSKLDHAHNINYCTLYVHGNTNERLESSSNCLLGAGWISNFLRKSEY